MATYVSIPDTSVDGSSPGTEDLFFALRDNPLAIAQGDASAPKIQDSAFTEPPNPLLAAGNNIIFRSTTSKTAINNTMAVVKIISSPASGTIRTRFSASRGAAQGASARIYKNGVAVGTIRSLSTTPTEFTEDFTIVKGDYLEVWTASILDNPTTVHFFSIECSIKKYGSIILE